jgi:hypothetical protein
MSNATQITQANAEQIRFYSAKTGEHVLDSYLELVERGNKTLYEMLDDLFDPNTGELYAGLIQVRVNPSTLELEIRSGQYLDPNLGWQPTGNYIFAHRGLHADATEYHRLDTAIHDDILYMCVADHTSTSSAIDLTKFVPVIDGSFIVSQSNAAQNAAQSAAQAAEDTQDLFANFDQRYLGAKSSDPTTDNDGNALTVGAIYFNTGATPGFRAFDGTDWVRMLRTDQVQTFTKTQVPSAAVGTRLASGNFSIDGTKQIVRMTLVNAINVTFIQPTSIEEDAIYKLILIAGDSNPRGFSWTSDFKFPEGIPPLTNGTQIVGARDIVSFIGGPGNTLIYDGHQTGVR